MRSVARFYVDLYRALMKVSILANIQYRASGFIWMIGSILEPLIYLVVWSTVASSKGGAVGGYTARQFAAYYITLMVVNHITFSWIMQVFQFRIQYGSLAQELLRPVHPIHADIADNIAYKIVQLTIVLPALILLIWYFKPEFNFTPTRFAIALPVVFLAFITRFLLEWTLALAAFWTTRLNAINNTYFAVMMFMSGRMAPMALLPHPLQAAAEKLPFYYVVAFPVDILTRAMPREQIIDGVATLVAWLIAAIVLIRFTWGRAVRNFSAVGS